MKIIISTTAALFLALATLQAKAQQSGSAPVSTPAATCKNDWHRCSDNADMVNNYSDWVDAQSACQRQATDMAKFGSPIWPWLSFNTFRSGSDYASGRATLIEKNAQFQNQYGAMEHVRVTCDYDLRRKVVLSITGVPN